ncbi:hypothetical protein MANES_07G113602v8 [Manihot esculenta]|uniref:Uncharacterized protein n=1 Tax=Manihot esculenta TaxID=3983 RepID=A0ACB7HEY2_MANES|nr:hypothetical protein MANES_07G113602v8 [Manihot esculenta]
MLMMETLFCVKSFLSYPRVKSDATPSIVWVSQLIDETSLSWNIQKFKEVFEEEEVKNIEAIPIAMFWGEDKLTWHFSRSCMYSVKSGYWVACDIRDAKITPATSRAGSFIHAWDRNFWRQVWRLHLPAKLAIFL